MFSTVVEDFNQLVQHTIASHEKNNNHTTTTNSTTSSKKRSPLDFEHNLFPTHTKPAPHNKFFTTRHWEHESTAAAEKEKKNNDTSSVAVVRSEHDGYGHLSIFSSLKTLEQEVSGSVRDYFLSGEALLAYLVLLCIPVVVFQIVMVIYMSSNFGISVWNIITSRNPLLWLSITYMDKELEPFWLFLIGLVFIFMIMSKTYYIRYLQMEERDLIVKSSTDTNPTTSSNSNDAPPDMNNNRILLPLLSSNLVHPFFKHKPKILDNHISFDPPINVKQSSSAVKTGMNNSGDVDEYVEDVQLAHDMTQHSQFTVQQILGRCCSAIIFLSLLTVQVLFTYYFYVAHDYSYQLWDSLLLTAVLTIINWLWKIVAETATKLEYHTDVSSFYTSLIIKNYIFRYVSTIITFSISQLQVFLPYSVPSTNSLVLLGSSSLPSTDCRFVILTEQYMFLMLSEILQTVLLSVVYPEFNQRYVLPCVESTSQSENDYKLEFSIWQEFLDLNYKEFILFLGFAPFPSITLGMVFVIILELYCDRRKLIKYCKPVILTHARFVTLITILSLFSFILAVALVPNGTIFIIYGFENNCQLLL